MKYQSLALLGLLWCAPAVVRADETAPPTLQRMVPGWSSARAEGIVGARSRAVVRALQNNDMATLARYVHPTAGVTISPYVFVSRGENLNFRAGQIKHLANHPKKWDWGTSDGEGAPMNWTWNEFRQNTLVRRNYLPGARESFNQIHHNGNILNNIDEAYPGAIIARYYLAGANPKYGGLDWRALYLAWRPVGKTWYLVGLANDEWST